MPKQIETKPGTRLCKFDAQCFSPGLRCRSKHSPGVEQVFKVQQDAKTCHRRDVGKKSPNKDNKEKPKKKCAHCKKKAVARYHHVYCNYCYYFWSPPSKLLLCSSSELLLTEEEKIWMQKESPEWKEPSSCTPESPEIPQGEEPRQWITEISQVEEPQWIPEIPQAEETPRWILEIPEIPECKESSPCTPEFFENQGPPKWIPEEDHAVASGEEKFQLSLKSTVVQALATQAGVPPLTLDTLLKIELYNFDIMKFAFLHNVNILYYIVHEYGFALEEIQAIHALLIHVIQRRDLDSITKTWNMDTSTMSPATLLLYCMAPSLSSEGLNILQEQLVDKMALQIMKNVQTLELELQGVGMSHADIATLSKLVH